MIYRGIGNLIIILCITNQPPIFTDQSSKIFFLYTPATSFRLLVSL
jgi:hypothetical protein